MGERYAGRPWKGGLWNAEKFFFGHSNDFGLASTMKQCDRFYHEAL